MLWTHTTNPCLTLIPLRLSLLPDLGVLLIVTLSQNPDDITVDSFLFLFLIQPIGVLKVKATITECFVNARDCNNKKSVFSYLLKIVPFNK